MPKGKGKRFDFSIYPLPTNLMTTTGNLYVPPPIPSAMGPLLPRGPGTFPQPLASWTGHSGSSHHL